MSILAARRLYDNINNEFATKFYYPTVEEEQQLRKLLGRVAREISDGIVWSMMSKLEDSRSRYYESIVKELNFHRTRFGLRIPGIAIRRFT